MGVGTEVVDDNLQYVSSMTALQKIFNKFYRTAQNILCRKFTLFRGPSSESDTSQTFANELPLPWTGYSELKHMGASKILQCIRFWPEAIIGEWFLTDLSVRRICSTWLQSESNTVFMQI
jgi:hypothetical protein